MSSCNRSFIKGFEKIAKKNFVTKVAAPAWYYRMNKTMNPLKSMKNHSVKGLKAIKAAEGLK